MIEKKAIKSDVSGFDVLKRAVLALLNRYPALDGRTITFSGLDEENSISMEPESGALVYTEKKCIDGSVKQECQFPFFVVYRSGASNEFARLNVNTFLDELGAWLCKESVDINGEEYRLTDYPTLTGGRKITEITRFNSYGLEPNENKTQDWVLPVTVNYTHEFTMW